MNLLFEPFVQNCLNSAWVAATKSDIKEEIDRSFGMRNRTYGTVIPDFQLIGPDGRLIVDAKYKLGDKLDPSDIYRCFLYEQAFGNVSVEPSACHACPVELRSGGALAIRGAHNARCTEIRAA
jgi:hypothetical protein